MRIFQIFLVVASLLVATPLASADESINPERPHGPIYWCPEPQFAPCGTLPDPCKIIADACSDLSIPGG